MLIKFPETQAGYPLVSSNVAIGNPLEMGVSIGKSPINSVFSIAMFDYSRIDLLDMESENGGTQIGWLIRQNHGKSYNKEWMIWGNTLILRKHQFLLALNQATDRFELDTCIVR